MEENEKVNKNLFIVDNITPDHTVKKYLYQWCGISKQFDIATGYFEIGALLELDGEWQKLDKIRIILGSEVTKRTKNVINEAVAAIINQFNVSIEDEKEHNEFLLGVPAILSALKCGKIECRVIDKSKFHAKTYITHFRDEYHQQFISAMHVPTGYALVGSSNFTKPGLTQNIELNVQLANDVDQLQNWFEERWQEAQEISGILLTSIEMHVKNYSPYDVYFKSMYELFKNGEQTVSKWEEHESKIFGLLSQYQKDGYNGMVKISNKYGGAFLCDGVGLGKTLQGLMLIERLVKKERKNVVLIVSAATRGPVWEATIKNNLPEILEGFYPFKIINHTDLLLEKNANLMNQISEQAECVIIDEAHHFRNRSSGRYRKLFEIMEKGCNKQMFMLTATPINNSFLDLQHLIELFTNRQDTYFKVPPLGIHSLTGHFKKMEAKLENLIEHDTIDLSDNAIETDSIFRDDMLVNELVIQRSRAYVKKSLSMLERDSVLFSVRQPPTVAEYSLKKSYGKLIDDFIDSFYRQDKITKRIVPILAMAIYSPYSDTYYIGDKTKIDKMQQGRQMQVVNLIRQLLLKRFESSAAAFEETCIRIFVRLKKFVEDYKEAGNKREILHFFQRQERVFNYIEKFVEHNTPYTMEELEDDLPEYLWDDEDNLDIKDFDIPIMIQDTLGDLEVLSNFIRDIMDLNPSNDDKINTLIKILRTDEKIKNKKVIVFTEFRSTAQYIFRELSKYGFEKICEIDGQSKVDRRSVIERFSPYYNDKTSATIENEIQILIATDILAEGLNLQDASCLINYELHWNPVRLMQRIGRVDRRRSQVIETLMLNDHPELEADRENAYYWNFLPPEELESLLSLYQTVSKKTLRISKTFGIEGQQLLTPDDDYEAFKDFNSAYEGTESKDEALALEFQKMMQENPNYEVQYSALPQKIFSGKNSLNNKGIFFCYELPSKRSDGTWTLGDGLYRWYILDPETKEVTEYLYDIWQSIKSTQIDERVLSISEENFVSTRKSMEAYINKTYMRNIQAPLGVKPRLVTWMQLN